MAAWYYYEKKGTKVGPISESDLKKLVSEGVIVRGTIVETEDGHQTIARNVKNLFSEMEQGSSKIDLSGAEKTFSSHGIQNAHEYEPQISVPHRVTNPPVPSAPSFPVTSAGSSHSAASVSSAKPLQSSKSASFSIPPAPALQNMEKIEKEEFLTINEEETGGGAHLRNLFFDFTIPAGSSNYFMLEMAVFLLRALLYLTLIILFGVMVCVVPSLDSLVSVILMVILYITGGFFLIFFCVILIEGIKLLIKIDKRMSEQEQKLSEIHSMNTKVPKS
ncbi:MAG: hypothetical protein Q4C96_05565 [Planctomycetia bacterium]|nr:hypothetical protein [Planctomycetia bacterium]